MVIDKINEDIFNKRFNVCTLAIPKHLPLADPDFFKTAEIDMLIGESIFYDI